MRNKKYRPDHSYSIVLMFVMLFNDAIKCRYYVAILLCAGCTGICGSIKVGWSVLLIGSEPAAVQAAVNGWCS
jgi:hypothetical protein